tara:strand:- start:17817 stop:18854 length:1038 start_codon:yes stop_codon:yes gene_type:complete
MSKIYPLVISNVERDTPNAVLISFEVPKKMKEKFQFEAGQYLTLEAKIDENTVRRSYSICSAPIDGLQVGIKEVPEGVFSTYANRLLKAGETIMVAPPEGRFKYENSGKGQRLVAFAAGSGITPIMSIIKTALSDHKDSSVYLVYGNKTPEDTLFYEALKELQGKYGDRLIIKWVFSRSNITDSFFGRIEAPIVKNTLTQLEQNIDKFYLCGPEGMIQSVSDTLVEKGVDSAKILFELFTSSSEAPKEITTASSAALEIVYDDVTYKIDAQEGKSILDIALDNKLDVPYSCQGGVCSSCIARIKSGKAEMESNQILTDDEVEEGLILTCQAHATSSEVVVDYDDV